MPAVLYLPEALEDLERLRDFLAGSDAIVANETVLLICDAVTVLEAHPLIGRPAGNSRRELVVSRGRTGYLVLYRYDENDDRVLVSAIRHQREAGYDPERR